MRAEAGVAQRLEGIIIADNDLRDRQRELKQILNKPRLSVTTATVLVPVTEPEPIHYQINQQKVVDVAIENRMDMLELQLQIAQDIENIDYYKNQALPLIILDYVYNLNGLGAARTDSLDVLYDKNFEDHSVGLSLLIPLGNVPAKSRVRQAFYRRRQRLATEKYRKSLIRLEVLKAVDQLEANWQRILAGRQSVLLESRLYEAEMRQYELGLVTSTDVLEAQTNFTDAQSAEIRAIAEYQIALVDLAFATGTLHSAAKVEWEPIVPEIP